MRGLNHFTSLKNWREALNILSIDGKKNLSFGHTEEFCVELV